MTATAQKGNVISYVYYGKIIRQGEVIRTPREGYNFYTVHAGAINVMVSPRDIIKVYEAKA